MDEQQLVKIYMDLTGTSEPVARNVFMMVCGPTGQCVELPSPQPWEPAAEAASAGDKQGVRFKESTLVLLSALVFWTLSGMAMAANSLTNQIHTAQPFGGPLSLADAVNLALRQSPSILRAQKDLEASKGIAIQTRAIALPNLAIGGSYSAVQLSDVDIITAPGFNLGTPQNWSTQIKLVQSLYQGGKMLSAFRAAELTKQQSLLTYQTAVADTVLSVQLVYYDVLLAAQQITVQEASVNLLTNELRDTTRRFEAGTVPRFNVLRAEVELANARPKLINARNNFRISKNNLANLLGLNVPPGTVADIPLQLSGKLEAEPFELELPRVIDIALEKRTELGALRKTEALRKEDIINAKAGYKPVLQGYVGYDVHNSILTQDLTVTDYGWIGGVQLSWNLFDGLRTQGRVKEAQANFERAGVDLDDKMRGVELEVRTAYSNFIEAREVLESQKKVVEEAEESLRLASARSEAGTGTQLDVLSAQTALTEARTTQIQALHDYEAARARLQRAIGMNVPNEPSLR
jgi:outer membrane protein TolC